ncbi:MAG TPA: immunoglobulin domain-containing protein [Candidatus Olsenella excrementigallinarum]|nr:immunoglobulin domain-containing protein [Candidatus Olsenella excrementigallinarum]
MKKRFLSLLCALTLCLGLMPATALAADGIELYVGGQLISESGCYENQGGTWTKVEGTGPSSGQFYYDADTVTLTLNGAEISHNESVSVGSGAQYRGSVIAFSQSSDVSLTIVVSQGTSTITAGGIRVDSTTGNASLSIKGPGSLDVEPTAYNSGITIAGQKNVKLDIDGADVTANTVNHYGVYLLSYTAATTSTITVNNGSLTIGSYCPVGIYYYWIGDDIGTSSLTVSGNAVVDTRNSQIMAQNKETAIQVGAGSDGNGGIVFNGKNGTVYGKVELQDDLTINEGETLTVGKDASLTVPDGKTLTNDGTITVESGGKLEGTTTGNGTLKIAPTITTQPQDVEVKENETATFTVKVTGTEPLSYQWQQSTDKGSSWTNIASATSDTYTTGKTTMDMSGTQYRCVVSNSAGSVTSNVATLTVNEHVHTWGNPVWNWSEDGKTCTVTFTCQNDETHKETPAVTVTSAVKTPATCTETGVTTYTATVDFNGQTYTDTKEVADIPATGHRYENGKCIESLAKTGDDSMLPITVLSILAVVSIATGVFALRRSRI